MLVKDKLCWGLLCLLLGTNNALAEGEKSPLSEKLKSVGESVSIKPKKQTEDEKLREKVLGKEQKPVDGVNVKVMEVNVSKNSKISVEVAPKIKSGDTIDNKDEATINYNLKF